MKKEISFYLIDTLHRNDGDKMRSIDDIHEEIYKLVKKG